MSIGLDLGSTQFRSLRRQGRRLVGRACPCVMTCIADTPAHRLMIERDDLPFLGTDRELILLGDAAIAWSERAPVALRPLLKDGRIPADDPLARDILPFYLDAVLPPAIFPEEVCAFTVPGESLPDAEGIERSFFSRLIELRGYRPVPVGQGMAAVLAELGDAGFTGIGMNLGATQCEFALVQNGAERARCCIPWGVVEILEGFDQDPLGGMTIESIEHSERAIADFLVEVLLEAGLRIGQADGFRMIGQPLSIICTGGLVQRPDFERLFQRAWQRAAWPISVRAIRMARDAAYTIARGCLIQAKLEVQTLAYSKAA